MMRTLLFTLLLGGAGLSGATGPSVLDITLQESRAEVLRKFGPPEHAARAGRMLTWQYGEFEDAEYSWSLTLDGGQLVSAVRNYPEAQDFARLFPGPEVWRGTIQGMAVRSRRLDGGRGLVAVGTHQLILLRIADIPRLFPWLAEAFRAGPPSRP